MKLVLRRILRLWVSASAVAGAASSPIACSGDHAMPAGGGTYGDGGRGKFIPGGACGPEGATKKCGTKLGEHNGVLSCYEGESTCVEGAWGACGSGSVTNFKSPT